MATTLTARVRAEVRTATENDREGRISADDARKIRTAGLDAVRTSHRPNQTFEASERVIEGAMSRPMTTETRGYLERFSTLGAGLVSQASPPVTSALNTRVSQALLNSFGIGGGASVLSSSVLAGQTYVNLRVDHPAGPLTARAHLTQGADGKPTIGAIAFIDTPSLVPAPPAQPFVYSEPAARSAAISAMTRHTLQLAGEAGNAAMFEVWMRTARLTPSQLASISNDESPIGVGPDEVQFMAAALWGDNAVYYTVNRLTGAASCADFN